MSPVSARFSELNQQTAWGRVVSACARSKRIAHWILSSLAVLLVLAGFVRPTQAGCHSLGEDWYHDYHHGHQANSVLDFLNPSLKWQTEQRFVFEDGEMRAISNPLPERCQGPQCQESPTQQNLDGLGVIEQQRTLTLGISSTDRLLSTWPVPANDWTCLANLKSLAGFPASLEEPPR